jgi:hypothetical protein
MADALVGMAIAGGFFVIDGRSEEEEEKGEHSKR